MAINENTGLELEENQQQPPATPPRRALSRIFDTTTTCHTPQVPTAAPTTALTPLNIQHQDRTYSPSDFILNSSNRGNQIKVNKKEVEERSEDKVEDSGDKEDENIKEDVVPEIAEEVKWEPNAKKTEAGNQCS